MVAHLLRLRLLLLRNTLTRNVWQLIGVIFGGLYAVVVLGLVVVGLVALGASDPEFANVALILGGSALLLGWVLGPIFVSGSDQSLDLPTLATFPIPPAPRTGWFWRCSPAASAGRTGTAGRASIGSSGPAT